MLAAIATAAATTPVVMEAIIQAASARRTGAATTAGRMAVMVRINSRQGRRLRLSADADSISWYIRMLESIHLGGHCSGFESVLSEIDTQRNSIHAEMVHISTEFQSDPKPDVDYGKLVARMPQLTAQNDSLDEMLFKMASRPGTSPATSGRIDDQNPKWCTATIAVSLFWSLP
jgi:hypothetical protein